MFKEFKEFAIQGNMVDMAVGLVIGAAFGTVISSLVNDMLMPVVSSVFGAPDFGNMFSRLQGDSGLAGVDAAREAGDVILAYGRFINSIIAFLLVALALFFVVKGINKAQKAKAEEPEEPTADQALLTEIRDLLKK